MSPGDSDHDTVCGLEPPVCSLTSLGGRPRAGPRCSVSGPVGVRTGPWAVQVGPGLRPARDHRPAHAAGGGLTARASTIRRTRSSGHGPRAGQVATTRTPGPRWHLMAGPRDSELVPPRAVPGRGEESNTPGFRASPNRRPARAGGFMYRASLHSLHHQSENLMPRCDLLHCAFFPPC